MFSKEIFSERLRSLRTSKGVKQSDLGTVIGVTDKTVSAMEAAYRGPSIEVASALADYFGVSLDYLAGRTDKPEVNR